MADLSKDVFTIDIQSFKNGFDKGTWTFCRDEFYIRTDVDAENVDDKIKSLVEITDKTTNSGIIKVIEPFIVNEFLDKDGSVVNEIISGNTRARALLQLFSSQHKVVFNSGEKDAYTVDITFAPVPYRVYDREIGLEEAISVQTATNDSTKKHNPLDIALKAFELKGILEKQYIEGGAKPKAAAGMATDYLVKLFKRSKQNLAQYFSVIGKGTDSLHQYVKSGKMSVDTAATIVQKGERSKMDAALNDLWIAATTTALSNGIKPDQAVIYKSQVLDYFTDKGDAKSPVPSSNPPDNSGKVGFKEIELKVDRDMFVDGFTAVYTRIFNTHPDECTLENAKDLDALNNAMLRCLIKTSGLSLPTDTAIDEYEVIRKLWLNRYGDIDSLANTIAEKDIEYSDILKTVNFASKPLSNIKKKNEPELTEEVSTEVETLEFNVDDSISGVE